MHDACEFAHGPIADSELLLGPLGIYACIYRLDGMQLLIDLHAMMGLMVMQLTPSGSRLQTRGRPEIRR